MKLVYLVVYSPNMRDFSITVHATEKLAVKANEKLAELTYLKTGVKKEWELMTPAKRRAWWLSHLVSTGAYFWLGRKDVEEE